MAVKFNKKARRLAVMALAISAVTLPGVASADPDNGGRGGWRSRGDADARPARSEDQSRQARSEGQDNGWRSRQAPQQQVQARPAPAPQAAPQAQANYAERRDRGATQGGERRNWNGGQAGQVAPVAQARWNGGNRQEQTQTWNGGNRQQTDQARTWNRDGNRDGATRNWTDANRDGDRRQRDERQTRDRSSGRVSNGYYYGTSGGNYSRDRDHDGDRDGHRWNRQWRNNSQYNWSGYRASHPSYFRLGSYYAPYRNYSYRRLSIGFYLDQLFFGQNYWIEDPRYYRLPDVYGPYRWVRYYDDAVLVDIYSGEVVDVIYDFFW